MSLTYSVEGDEIVLRLTREQFQRLLLFLGMAGAGAHGDEKLFRAIFRLANQINEGNPNFTPYQLDTPYQDSGDDPKAGAS